MIENEINRLVSRRSLLAGAAAGALVSGLGRPGWAAADPWAQAQSIVSRLANVTFFPARDFVVTAYGAVGDGTTDNYAAFAAAIAACHNAGGGRVVVPAGTWYCAGSVMLLSNVNFHLSANARIAFSPNPADFAKYGPYDFGANGKLVISRWQGNDCYNFCAPVYAYGQTNIALTGDDMNTCILDGQANVNFSGSTNWWTWKTNQAQANPVNQSLSVVAPWLTPAQVSFIQGTGTGWQQDQNYLPCLSEAGVPLAQRVFGIGHFLRPCMIEFINCTNVLLQGYQTNNTPFWQHHPVGCRNVVIRNVYANSSGANNDGFDPEACTYVLADSVTFNTGDDCIAIKSAKDTDTEFGPAQYHVIQNCTMNSGHGGITLGSEMAAGIQYIYAQNLQMLNQNWASSPLNIAIRLKANMNRGGYLKNFYVRNVTLPNGVNMTPSYYTPISGGPIPKSTVSTSQGGVVTFDCDYSPASDNVRTRPPIVQNVNISGVTVSPPPGKTTTCYQAIVIQGPVAFDYDGPLPAPTVYPVQDVTISNCDFGTPVNASKPYYLYNTQNLVLSNVTIAGTVYNTTLSA